VLSRLPAEAGILVTPNNGRLPISFVEDVFMKNGMIYKATCCKSDTLKVDFWEGKASFKLKFNLSPREFKASNQHRIIEL